MRKAIHEGRLPSMPCFLGEYLGSISVHLMTLAVNGALMTSYD